MRSLALSVLVLALALPARAADWLMIVGTEEGRPEVAVKPFGFLQVSAETLLFAEAVKGLEGEALRDFDGEMAAFNDLEEPVELSIRRARLGMRGVVPGTDRKVNYFVALEAGMNAATRDVGVALLDASVTLNYIPGLRLRVGQMKLPTMDEAIEQNPIAHNSVQFSPLVTQLLLEQPVVAGKLEGPAYALRDLGVMAFDSFGFLEDHLQLSYAVMLSQGRMGGLDVDESKDLTGRLQVSWLPEGKSLSPRREEISAFAWAMGGGRVIDGEEVLRARAGAGALVRRGPVRARLEVVAARGAVPMPPAFEGLPYRVVPDGTAFGWAFDASVEVLGPLSLSFGIDELYRQWDVPREARLLRAVGIGAELEITEKVRLVGDYTFRQLEAPWAGPDAQRVAATMGDVLSAQLTVMF